MTDRDEPINWQRLAEGIGADPHQSGNRTAQQAVAFLLGDEAIRQSVDWYVEGLPAAEHARSVLWLLRPDAARSRCLEIYRTAPEPERRRSAVELFRVIATADDLPLVDDLLADPDPAIQVWGIGVLDQLLFGRHIDADDAAPFLQAAARHSHPQVRERHAFLCEYLASQEERQVD